MVSTTPQKTNDLVFHPFLPIFLVKNALLLGIGAYFALLATRSGHSWWLVGSILTSWIDLLVVCRYNAQLILIREFTLICRRGTLRVRENSFPLMRVDLETDQGLLGRIMDYGTVRILVGSDMIVLHQVAPISQLRSAIARRQNEMILLLVDRRTIVNGPVRGRATRVVSPRQRTLLHP
jgi:membrane protein YdbS with pleckstrin-like domain